MSTFGGVMVEFPDIRVDQFRLVPGLRPPLACFLSHVHSDHLNGLESFKSPFIYCSPATKELLLRLEHYAHRYNYATKILERRVQQYKHLDKVLRPVPLETPTQIELAPGHEIQVTLFDADHCTGAVMFLFEGDGKAVLYTGDIRSEPWFVNSLSRNPFLIEYTTGIKTLDCIYLDTSNTGPKTFPPKADGLKELLQKVSKYPADTVFHFSAWTFGYEDVWMALSKALKTPVHVDRYKMRLYEALKGRPRGKSGPKEKSEIMAFIAWEGPVLTGYQCGNSDVGGCLTNDPTVRVHSCEKGMHCPTLLDDRTVWIRPIVTRGKDGIEYPEVGVGGGGGDLSQTIELEFADARAREEAISLTKKLDSVDSIQAEVREILLSILQANTRTLSLDDLGLDLEDDQLSWPELMKAMARKISEKQKSRAAETSGYNGLPRTITFPYSRHSSYEELCHLLRIFKPKDVYPCTVHEEEWHLKGLSIESLFGDECSKKMFRHDIEMEKLFAVQIIDQVSQQTRFTTPSTSHGSPVLTKPVKISSEEMISSSLNSKRAASAPATPSRTASHSVPEISAASPGSASQNLRRKAILELRNDGVKRPRFHSASPALRSPSRSRKTLEVIDLISEPDEGDVHTPDLGEVSETIEVDAAIDLSDEIDIERHYLTFYDALDKVDRCMICSHEVWRPKGFCTGCSNGATTEPYFEVSGPEDRTRPEISINEYTISLLENDGRRAVVGDFLDDESSAYDSQDSDREFREEYDEADSFIDDQEIEEVDAEDEASNDDEPDYETMYHQLRQRHSELARDYSNLVDEHEEFRREILGSDFESDEGFDDMDERDEDGLIIIEPRAPDPVITDLILSLANEQSQQSEISEERIQARALAFEAAAAGEWHGISLASTTMVGDHTYPEVEL